MSAGETSRVFELLQRTNQLNATLTRTSLEQLQGYLASPARHVMHVAILRDRFGDYGLIGFVACEIEGARWRLLELALSCRAAGRGVERAMLSHLGALAQKAGAESLVLRYVAGPRNQEMLRILRECGFAGPGDAGGAEGVPAELVRDLKPGTSFAHPDWLSVSTPAAPARSEEPRPHAAEP
jgi:FkbH-like protein